MVKRRTSPSSSTKPSMPRQPLRSPCRRDTRQRRWRRPRWWRQRHRSLCLSPVMRAIEDDDCRLVFRFVRHAAFRQDPHVRERAKLNHDAHDARRHVAIMVFDGGACDSSKFHRRPSARRRDPGPDEGSRRSKQSLRPLRSRGAFGEDDDTFSMFSTDRQLAALQTAVVTDSAPGGEDAGLPSSGQACAASITRRSSAPQ